MGALVVSLLPFIIGSALVPLQIIINILLLKSPQQGLAKASAYVAGMTIMRLFQGLLFGFILTGATTADKGDGRGPVASSLLLVLGLLLLISAFRKWWEEEDPDAPPPKWLTMLDTVTVLRAFALGLGLVLIAAKLWVFTLTALATIGEAQLGQPSSTIAFLLFVFLAESLLLLLILLRLIAPTQSTTWLDNISAWLTTNNRAIVIAVSSIFGLLFLYQGVSGLLS